MQANIAGKNEQQRNADEQIDWEVELTNHKKAIPKVIKKKKNATIFKKSNIYESHELTVSDEELDVINTSPAIKKDVDSKIDPTGNIQNSDSDRSSFERKYEEYITNVYKFSFEEKNNITKRSSTRRKPSSGFDYIRKKKKTRPTITYSPSSARFFKKAKIHLTLRNRIKTEEEIHSEIHKWVLNKSVGQTILHKAARSGYIDVVSYCLEKLNLNPNVKDNAGYTPLHEACAKGFFDVARCLLLYGADLSETAHSGIRPIHEASESGSVEIFQLLLQYGADPQITTYNGKFQHYCKTN